MGLPQLSKTVGGVGFTASAGHVIVLPSFAGINTTGAATLYVNVQS
jgi:hypothetical protein